MLHRRLQIGQDCHLDQPYNISVACTRIRALYSTIQLGNKILPTQNIPHIYVSTAIPQFYNITEFNVSNRSSKCDCNLYIISYYAAVAGKRLPCH